MYRIFKVLHFSPHIIQTNHINWSIFQYAFYSVRWWKRKKNLVYYAFCNCTITISSTFWCWKNIWILEGNLLIESNGEMIHECKFYVLLAYDWIYSLTRHNMYDLACHGNGTCCLIPLCILCRSTATSFNSFHSPINILLSNGMISMLHPSLSRPLQIW